MNVMWSAGRHLFDEGDYIIALNTYGHGEFCLFPLLIIQSMRTDVAALSGPGGVALRLFNSLKARVSAEKYFPSPDSDQFFEPSTCLTEMM